MGRAVWRVARAEGGGPGRAEAERMKRDLYAMTSRTYDVIIVGGGITGACIARDAALRGLNVALVEKGDFASATSAASSKLIHGGLRYLQNLELGLVRESLRERRVWSNIAPHLIDPLTFLMPLSGGRLSGRLKMGLALTAYDWLAYDRNRLDDPRKSIPSHRTLSRDEAIALEPGIESEHLTGAAIFYDYQMYSPERLALECILDAASCGASVANYVEALGFERDGDRVVGVRVRDRRRGGFEFTIRGHVTVNAAGPWADILMAQVSGNGASRNLIRSKGIHIITRDLTNGHGLAVPTDEGHFFILPWRGHSLIGTTDTVYEGHPDDFCVTEQEISDFVALIRKGYPVSNLQRSDVLHFYGGLRPIVDTTTSELEGGEEEEGADSYNASRAAEIVDHERETGVWGMITAIGGKWTTSRSLAEQIVDLLMEKLEKPEKPCTTDFTPTYGGDVGPYRDFLGRSYVKYSSMPEFIIENLTKNYGSRIDDLFTVAEEDERLTRVISDEFPDIAAQVVYAVREEMALTLEDVLFRRSGLGTLGRPSDETLAQVAALMARELHWTDEERQAQLAQVEAHFRPCTDTDEDSRPIAAAQ